MIRLAYKALVNFLFPKLCSGCNRLGSYLCSECINNILQSELVCSQCERPAIGGKTHPLCLRKYGLDGLWSLGLYQGALRKSIQRLKYRWLKDLAETLVDLTIEYWARYSVEFIDHLKQDQGVKWIIIPVPLHQNRLRWRGFNQSALLGQLLSKRIGLSYCEYLLRVRNTKPQVKLKAWERKKNVKDAFSLSPNILISQYPNVLLIDDVWTTGATLKECCYVLKKAGAKKVWAITLAR